MSRTFTIYLCDECGERKKEHEILKCYVKDKPYGRYHICYKCIDKFSKKIREEVHNARKGILREIWKMDSRPSSPYNGKESGYAKGNGICRGDSASAQSGKEPKRLSDQGRGDEGES